MKKYFILLLFFFGAVSCKNESLSIGSSNYIERHNLPTSRNIDYEWYLEFYEQIYSVIENISQDTILNNLISEENLYLEFDSEALIENGLTTLLLETFTSQQINILSYDFFGGTLADFENDEGISDELRALLSDLLVMDYIEPEYLFELLHESNFTIGETIILYGISASHNFVAKKTKNCFVVIKDNDECKVEVLNSNWFPYFPNNNEKFLLEIYVNNIYDVENIDIESLINSELYMTNYMSFESLEMMSAYIYNNPMNITEAEKAECYLNWMNELETIREEYERDLNNCINTTNSSETEMQSCVDYVTAKMEQKKVAAEQRLQECLGPQRR